MAVAALLGLTETIRNPQAAQSPYAMRSDDQRADVEVENSTGYPATLIAVGQE
jgi:hypothetical protein